MFLANTHSIHGYVNGVCKKFSELEGKFYGKDDRETIFFAYENSKHFRHLQKVFQELLIYKLLRESRFNLLCPLLSLACVLVPKSLKIVTICIINNLVCFLLSCKKLLTLMFFGAASKSRQNITFSP